MSRSKVAVTDEPLDAYVNRPLAAHVVRAVERTAITPNQLTLISALWGTAAGVCMAIPNPYAPVIGAGALFISMVFDCSDGQLARARGGGSVVGRIFDGYADYWVATCLHFGMLAGLIQVGLSVGGHSLNAFELFLFMLATGGSMAINSGRFDFYKQRYLAHTGATREAETPELYRTEAARSGFIAKWALRAFAHYIATIQKGDRYHASVAAARATASDPARVARFVRENGTLVRLWSLSGPTMHNAAICVFACLIPWQPHAFVGYCLFALIGVNAYTFVLWILQRRVLRRETALHA